MFLLLLHWSSQKVAMFLCGLNVIKKAKYMNCMLTSPASDMAIAGPAGVMLPSKCHIGINF